jgi:hypothetical protein
MRRVGRQLTSQLPMYLYYPACSSPNEGMLTGVPQSRPANHCACILGPGVRLSATATQSGVSAAYMSTVQLTNMQEGQVSSPLASDVMVQAASSTNGGRNAVPSPHTHAHTTSWVHTQGGMNITSSVKAPKPDRSRRGCNNYINKASGSKTSRVNSPSPLAEAGIQTFGRVHSIR